MILVQSFSQHWFFIMSKLGNNLVMDVAYCRTTPGTQVISYTKKNPPRPNQLWGKEYDGNTFYLVSKLHSSCRIAVKVINLCSYAAYLWLTSFFYIFLQGGNAHIDNSGSLFREENYGEFIALVEIESGNALDVRESKTLPDTPILALPMSDNSSQKWKYSIPMPFVSSNYICVLETNVLSTH